MSFSVLLPVLATHLATQVFQEPRKLLLPQIIKCRRLNQFRNYIFVIATGNAVEGEFNSGPILHIKAYTAYLQSQYLKIS